MSANPRKTLDQAAARGTIQPTDMIPNWTLGATALKRSSPDDFVAYALANGAASSAGRIDVSRILKGVVSADDTAALQAACNLCVANNLSLFVPTGSWGKDMGAIVTSGVFSIYAEPGGTLNFKVSTTSAIKMVNGAAIAPYFSVIGVALNNTEPAATDITQTAGIEISGSGGLVLYPDFVGCSFTGFYAGIKNTTGVVTGIFGQESQLNWATFDMVRVYNGANFAKYAIWHTNGSGTGATYVDIKGELDASGTAAGDIAAKPAYVRVDRGGGSTTVVSDILILGAHIAGADAALLSIDPLLVYRVNLRAGGSQVDANATHAIRYDPAPGATDWVIGNYIENCNIGGELDISDSLPLQAGSVIQSQGYHNQVGGGVGVSKPIGPYTETIVKIRMGASAGGLVDLDVYGWLEGIGGFAATAKYALTSNAGVLTATLLSSNMQPAAVVTFSATIAGLVASLKYTANPTLATSFVETQYRARGFQLLAQRQVPL